MSECQSKCACGDICRRVDEHLQHQCPKCNYEQRWTAENVAAAPAQPVATPMASVISANRDGAASEDYSDLAREIANIYWPNGTTSAQDALYDEQVQKVQRLLDAVAINDEAPQKLPAAAQPQRESEQPEGITLNMNLATAGAIGLFEFLHSKGFEVAALSPQTDSQETK